MSCPLSTAHPDRRDRTIRLTARDKDLILWVYHLRVIRRNQLQRLIFPSKNTANARLRHLHEHGYLTRRRLPVEHGEGSSQYLYLLASRGAQLVADRLGVDVAEIRWRRSQNHVSSMFLEHTLMVNDLRIAVELASRRHGHHLERWIPEDELKRPPDRVQIEAERGRSRRVAVVPDGYFCLSSNQRRAHFFLEADRPTVPNRRWAQKTKAYLAYVRSGAYARRYQTECLRVLTVTTSEKRMGNLLRSTAQAGGGAIFWFTYCDLLAPETILSAPIWSVPGQSSKSVLIDGAEPKPALTAPPYYCIAPERLPRPPTPGEARDVGPSTARARPSPGEAAPSQTAREYRADCSLGLPGHVDLTRLGARQCPLIKTFQTIQSVGSPARKTIVSHRQGRRIRPTT